MNLSPTRRSLHAVAELLGMAAGKPEDLYKDGSGVPADEVLEVDSAAAAYLAECFFRGDQALRLFAPQVPDEQRVLWPEHFDVGISVDEINYGVSPGDGYLDEPYAYVGPQQPREGSFWNAPFGATRPMRRRSPRSSPRAGRKRCRKPRPCRSGTAQ